ncbi:MAG: CPBP family intramembrane metalloprotease [Clostridia bacterium]|nr:CPBP family intramembrane metalloprotease [Clostridia bacterium]
MDKREKIGLVLADALKAGAYFLIYFLSQILVGIVLGVVFMIAMPSESIDDILVTRSLEISVISNVISIVFCVLLMRVMEKKSTAEGLDMNVSFIRPKTVLGLSLALGVFGQYAIAVFLSFIPFPESWIEMQGASSDLITSGSLAMQFIAVAIMAPLAEEIIFRVCIQGTLSRHLPKWVAIISTSFIFGLMHGNPIAIIYATVLGILMGWLYSEFKSIFPSMVFHFGFNLTSILMGQNPPFILFLIATAFFAVSLAFLAYLSTLNKTGDNTTHDEGDNDNEAL